MIAVLWLATAASLHAALGYRNVKMAKHHPGHPAMHVTRLVRLDHSEPRSFLEQERKFFQQASQVRGMTFLKAREETTSFSRVSEKQEMALRRVHETHKPALLQDSAQSGSSYRNSGIITLNSSRLRYHDRATPLYEGEVNALTALSNLFSQYVGPIGVGTVAAGNCGKSSALQDLEFRDTLGEESGGVTRGTSSQVELGKKDDSCFAENEAVTWVCYDTGSANLWVLSTECNKPPCSSATIRYNNTRSLSYKPEDQAHKITIQFGTGKLSGRFGIDDIHIGPFTVFNQTFGMITEEQGSIWDQLKLEGILGLAFPALSSNGALTFFDNIMLQKALHHNEFSFYLSNDHHSNAIFWGGVDRNFFEGEITWLPVVEPFYWAVEVVGFYIGEDNLLPMLVKEMPQGVVQGAKAIFDSGTTFNTAQGELFAEIMKRIPRIECARMTDEAYPPIIYKLMSVDGSTFELTLTKSQYMVSSGKGECSPAFMQINIPHDHGPGMVLGEVTMRYYYTVFHRGENLNGQGAKVGMAKSKHDEGAMEKLKAMLQGHPSFESAHSHLASSR